MIMKFLKSRLFLFFAFVLFITFIIGYDYAVMTSKNPAAASVKDLGTMTGMDAIAADDNGNTPAPDNFNDGTE